jgi:hypothetical protein
LISTNNFDIIALTETWLKNEDEMNMFKIPNYNLEFKHRTNKNGGGVLLYIKDCLAYSVEGEINDIKFESFEHISISITRQNSHKENFICIYKPPNTKMKHFINEFEQLLDGLTSKHIVICGDFNIDLLKYDHQKETKNFVDNMFSNCFIPLINKPTRISHKSATLIDNFWVKDSILPSQLDAGILTEDISDHLPIFYISDKLKSQKVISITQKRIINDRNLKKIAEELEQESWNELMNEYDTDIAYEKFHNKLESLLNKHCPLKIIKEKPLTNKPWLTSGLINACKKRTIFIKFL